MEIKSLDKVIDYVFELYKEAIEISTYLNKQQIKLAFNGGHFSNSFNYDNKSKTISLCDFGTILNLPLNEKEIIYINDQIESKIKDLKLKK